MNKSMRTREEIISEYESGVDTGIQGGSDQAVGNNQKLILEAILDIREILLTNTKK